MNIVLWAQEAVFTHVIVDCDRFYAGFVFG